MNWDEFRKYKRLRYLYLKLKNDGGTPATSDAVTRGCVNRHLLIHYSQACINYVLLVLLNSGYCNVV